MKIGLALFPQSRWARVRLACLVGVLLYVFPWGMGALLVYRPHEGDLLFQSLPHNKLVDAIEGITQSEWSHCGIAMQKDGRWVVAEAIGEVRETPLWLWAYRGRGHSFAAYRPKPEMAWDLEKLRGAVAQRMGLPYDFRYAPGDDEIYCSELIWKCYQSAGSEALGDWQALGSLNWQPHEAFIREMEAGALPLDRMMITPVALTHSSSVERVWPR